MSVSSFAYAGLGVSDIDAWTRFGVDILGMEAGEGAAGTRILRIDERPWRIALHQSASDDIAYAAFETEDAAALGRLVEKLEKAGYPTQQMSGADKDARFVRDGVVLQDPDGLRIELVHGVAPRTAPFTSPVGATFVTGDQGLGHLVISTHDVERSLAFYQALGFQISDYIETPLGPMNVRLVFMHCNGRHHTLALLPVPTPKRLNHLMFETHDVEDMLKAYERARVANTPFVRHLGRHTNDRMLSFYVRTPAGFDVEFGCGGAVIGPNWKIETHNAISFWGHAQ